MGTKSFSATAEYLEEGYGDVDKKAELLAANGVLMGTPEQIAADFNRHCLQNPDIGMAGVHIPISFSPDDAPQLTNERLVDLSLQYMREMAIEPDNTQWLIVRHGDTQHPHVHLLLNRINLDGEAIDLSFSKTRSLHAVRKIEQAEGLTVAQEQTKKEGNLQRPDVQTRAAFVQEMGSLISRVLAKSTDLTDFSKQLKELNIKLTLTTSKRQGGIIKGVVFSKNGRYVRGSALDPALSGPQLMTKMAQKSVIPLTTTTVKKASTQTTPNTIKGKVNKDPVKQVSSAKVGVGKEATKTKRVKLKR